MATTRDGSPPPLDAIDRAIVAALLEDGRLSVNELAGRVNVARATAYSRLERLRSSGVITGFSARVDAARLGLGVAALILLNIAQGEWRTVRAALLRLPGVQYLALTSGTFDLAVLVRVPDMETLRDVVIERLASMPEVRSTQTVFVLDEVAGPGAVADLGARPG